MKHLWLLALLFLVGCGEPRLDELVTQPPTSIVVLNNEGKVILNMTALHVRPPQKPFNCWYVRGVDGAVYYISGGIVVWRDEGDVKPTHIVETVSASSVKDSEEKP